VTLEGQRVQLKLPHPGTQRRRVGEIGDRKVIVLSAQKLGILAGPVEDGSCTQLVMFLVRHIPLLFFPLHIPPLDPIVSILEAHG